jgi:cytochrome c
MMKKQLFMIALVIACLYACNNSPEKSAATPAVTAEKTEPAAPAADDYSKNPDYQKGLDIIGKTDCLTCHKIEETSTGPAYRDIANKYTNDEKTIDMLAQKIIKGGSGVWGQVPMAAHPTLTPEEAKQLAKYVMIFKNK